MKKNIQFAFVGSIILAIVTGLAGCKKDSTPPTVIKGSASFPAGVSADLSGAKANLYTTLQEWQNNTPALSSTVTGSGDSVTYSINISNAGTYYLAVWKDVNNNGTMDVGDYLGWHGTGAAGSFDLTPIVVVAQNTYTINVTMYAVIPGH